MVTFDKCVYKRIRKYSKWKGNEVSYYPCVIMCENLSSWYVYLKHFLEIVIENLSSDKSYMSFDNERKENVRINGNEKDIVLRILTLCGIVI